MASELAYGYEDVRRALGEVGVAKGETVFVHSSIAFFGRCVGCRTASDITALLIRALVDELGPGGTIVVPTFTYSFPRGEEFNPKLSASRMGHFAETLRMTNGAIRSIDPIFSVAALGSRASILTEGIPNNSYCTQSVFGRLTEDDALVLNMNMGPSSTLLHYAERLANVPYRYDMKVTGNLVLDGERRRTDWTFFVRDLSDESSEPNFEQFEFESERDGFVQKSSLGRGWLTSIRSATLVERAISGIGRDRRYLTK